MRRALIFLVMLVFALVLVLAGCGGEADRSGEQNQETATKPVDQEVVTQEPTPEPRPDETAAPEPAGDPQETTALSLIPATVTRVVDGDTFHVNLDGATEKVRIIGVDTPETVHPNKPVEPFGLEASAFTKSKLSGKKVWLELDVQERCKYGRLLAYVWLEQPVSGTESEVRAKMFVSVK